MTKLTGKLRKAAILIASLDQRSADALLEQMSPEQAARVRSALMELEEIDVEEQRTVLHEFMRNRGGTPALTEGVELDPELQKKLSAPLPPSRSAPPVDPPRDAPRSAAAPRAAVNFQFLQETSPRELALVLQREHPQIAAVVMAHLAPTFAAQVLPYLPAETQTEILGRVADLESADQEILRELEQQLQSVLQYTRPERSRSKPGLGTVQAILDAVDHAKRGDLLDRLATADQELATRLAAPSFQLEQPAPLVSQAWEIRSAESLLNEEASAEFPEHGPELNELDEAILEIASSHHFAPLHFTEVLAFSDRDLAQLFRAAEPSILMLALAGAPPQFVERILRQVPPRDAKRLRQRLNQIGPLLLSDVADAQQQLAQLATQLAERGLVALPEERGFLAAA